MQNAEKPIRLLSSIGMILTAAFSAFECACIKRCEVVMALMNFSGDIGAGSDIDKPLFYVNPLLRLLVFGILFVLLRQQLKKAPNSQSALILFIMTLAVSVLLSVFAAVLRSLINRLLAFQGVNVLAGYNVVSSFVSMFSFIYLPAFPLLASASALNWYRCKFTQPA